MTKHTPSPWTRNEGERFSHDQSAGIRASDGMYIAAALDMNRFDKDDEVEANARLIAAAPELLEALQNAKSVMMDADIWNEYGDTAQIIDAAIAKAKGEK